MSTRLGTLLAVAALSPVLTAIPPRQPDISVDAVVAAGARYVASYQTQLTSIVADETYNQQIVAQTPSDPDRPRVRRLKSEIFFMFAPVRHDWITVRDVVSSNGKIVVGRPDLRQALRTLPASEVVATFRQHNARYNIGRTLRNTNEPTLSLLVLDDLHRGRFLFERRRLQGAGDTAVMTLAFTERSAPKLITDPSGVPAFAQGEVTVEAASGRIRRVELEATSGDVRLRLTTIYSSDARVGMWVPSRFREEYERGDAPREWSPLSPPPYERILCEAIYSNFRRFDTSVRIR